MTGVRPYSSQGLNDLALDRSDIQFATDDMAGHMAASIEGNWLLMKRMARHLFGNPRLVHLLRWQDT